MPSSACRFPSPSTLFPYTTLFRSGRGLLAPLLAPRAWLGSPTAFSPKSGRPYRSEEHTSELQSLRHLVCRLLLAGSRHHLHSFPTRRSSDLGEDSWLPCLRRERG